MTGASTVDLRFVGVAKFLTWQKKTQDFKREAGLWHAVVASVFNGMHVIFIPYALMKVNPASWMQMVTKHRATVALCKSRDLHWGLLATKVSCDFGGSERRERTPLPSSVPGPPRAEPVLPEAAAGGGRSQPVVALVL